MKNETDEVYESVKKDRDSEFKDMLRNIPASYIIIFIVFIGFMYLAFSKGYFKGKEGLLIIASLIIIILFVSWQQSQKSSILTEEEAKAILIKNLEKKQKLQVELPSGEIYSELDCNLQQYNGTPLFWLISFSIVSHTGYTKQYVAKIHPYSGIILGFKPKPQGIDWEESMDIMTVPNPAIRQEKYVQNYMRN